MFCEMEFSCTDVCGIPIDRVQGTIGQGKKNAQEKQLHSAWAPFYKYLQETCSSNNMYNNQVIEMLFRKDPVVPGVFFFCGVWSLLGDLFFFNYFFGKKFIKKNCHKKVTKLCSKKILKSRYPGFSHMAPPNKDASEGFSSRESGCPWGGGEFAVFVKKVVSLSIL